MHFLRRIFIVGVASAAMLFSGGPVMAHNFNGAENMVFPDSHSYSGAWPVTITGSEFSNGTDCLTLTQRGSSGGSASLVADGEKYPYGSFLVRRGILVVTITEPLYGQNGALLFIAHTGSGHIGKGIFEDDRGGSDFDTGALSFGMNGGC
jgi:hypothetical protein